MKHALILVIIVLAVSIAAPAGALEWCTSDDECGGSWQPCYKCLSQWNPDYEAYVYACGWVAGCDPDGPKGGDIGSRCYRDSECYVGLCCHPAYGECSFCFPAVDSGPLFAQPEDLILALIRNAAPGC